MEQGDIISGLRRAVDDQSALLRRYRGISIAYVLLVALAVVASFAVSGLSTFASWMLLSLPIAAVVMTLTSIFATDELETAKYRLAAAERERETTATALALAASGSAYGLFLRSFDAERQGLSASGVQVANISRTLGSLRNARHGLPGLEDDIEHLEANWRWKRELAVLAAMQVRAPAILLGNIGLPQDMRRELAATGIIELTIQVGHWWETFLALADRARVIVFYVEQATPMLVREMGHILQHRGPFIVMGEPGELAKLSTIPGIGEEFVDRATLVCGTQDVVALSAILNEVFGKP